MGREETVVTKAGRNSFDCQSRDEGRRATCAPLLNYPLLLLLPCTQLFLFNIINLFLGLINFVHVQSWSSGRSSGAFGGRHRHHVLANTRAFFFSNSINEITTTPAMLLSPQSADIVRLKRCWRVLKRIKRWLTSEMCIPRMRIVWQMTATWKTKRRGGIDTRGIVKSISGG